ncbi:MAG: PEP/pyruvate-binding domain-containing protein, partial [Gemmatimonadaceae bacterium]
MTASSDRWIRWFADLGIADVPIVGGKNASLGEMVRELGEQGVRVPDGFAITADAHRDFLQSSGADAAIAAVLTTLDADDVASLQRCGRQIRQLILDAPLPEALQQAILAAYRTLCGAGVTDLD